MKIGFVLDDGLDSLDGVQQYVLTVGKWLANNGHQVHYIVGQTSRSDVPNVHSFAQNIQVRFNKNRLAIPYRTSRTKIAALLQSEQFDVLHVQMPYSPHYAGKIVALASPNTAIVGTFHILPYGNLQTFGARLLGAITNRTRLRFDAVVSVSPAAAQFAHKVMRIKSTVVPNAINLAKFSKGCRLPQYNDDVQTIVFLGRLVERKGCIELLEAVKYLVRTNKFVDSRLVICGTGPLKHKIDTYIRVHKLEEYVTCVGKISEQEKPDYLASADLAVFPSKSGESFGIVLVEAIASGAVVTLGGDNPGYRFVLADHEAVIVNPTDTVQFADKIDGLLHNKKVAIDLGGLQRAYIEQFDVEIVGRQLVSTYQFAIAIHHNNSDNKAHE